MGTHLQGLDLGEMFMVDTTEVKPRACVCVFMCPAPLGGGRRFRVYHSNLRCIGDELQSVTGRANSVLILVQHLGRTYFYALGRQVEEELEAEEALANKEAKKGRGGRRKPLHEPRRR